MRAYAKTRRLGALLVAVVMLAGCGGSGGDSPTNPDPTTAAGFTSRGWDYFERGNMSAALADFDAALALDADFGAARTGRGWVGLVTAESAAAMLAAVGDFDAALGDGEDGAYVLGGRAAACLGAGEWSQAASGAVAAVAAGSASPFEHRSSFDADDLRLIIAFAELAQGDLTAALATANVVTFSGIDTVSPATWVVQGVTCATWTEAVLAHLQWISTTHSG